MPLTEQGRTHVQRALDEIREASGMYDGYQLDLPSMRAVYPGSLARHCIWILAGALEGSLRRLRLLQFAAGLAFSKGWISGERAEGLMTAHVSMDDAFPAEYAPPEIPPRLDEPCYWVQIRTRCEWLWVSDVKAPGDPLFTRDRRYARTFTGSDPLLASALQYAADRGCPYRMAAVP